MIRFPNSRKVGTTSMAALCGRAVKMMSAFSATRTGSRFSSNRSHLPVNVGKTSDIRFPALCSEVRQVTVTSG